MVYSFYVYSLSLVIVTRTIRAFSTSFQRESFSYLMFGDLGSFIWKSSMFMLLKLKL